jgi:hypothetical protein
MPAGLLHQQPSVQPTSRPLPSFMPFFSYNYCLNEKRLLIVYLLVYCAAHLAVSAVLHAIPQLPLQRCTEASAHDPVPASNVWAVHVQHG